MTVQIFLSTVSAEFRSYRDALRHDLDRPNVTVKVQEDFIATGTETLDMLDGYIRQCDAVIHLIGDMTGALAQAPSVTAIRRRYPDFHKRLPVLSLFLQPDGPALPYTQWEAWLALYHGKTLIICAPEEGAPRDERYRVDQAQIAAQRAHLDRLASVERYPAFHFANAARLAVDVLRSHLLDILASAEALHPDVREERDRQARLRAQEQAASRQRIVNFAPQGVAELFKDRAAPMAEILDTLLARHSALRVVAVLGQGGYGKTALACEVMRKLEQNETVHGLAYLSALTTGISFERIYHDSARMLGGEIEQKLMTAWKNGESAPAARIQALLEAYGHQRCILLLDNLESVMDGHGVLTDPEFQQFMNSFLAQNHGARLLVTSREPLNPSNEARKYQKLIPLDEGLPLEFAVELLRELDAGGELGLRDAPEALLKDAAEKALGYPAALEAIISILSEDKGLTLESLLADEALFDESVIKNLVKAALSRLDADGHRVMQAIAVYGRPVRDVAVHYLLQPFVDGATTRAALLRLTRGLYVNCKRSTGELILHPFYREFSYDQIPVDENAPYNRVTLELRAASYYAQLRAPRDDWKSIRDLEPQFCEFDHWLRAGAYDQAAEVLSAIDLDVLIWQGYARFVRDKRLLLGGRIQKRSLQMRHHDSLGQVHMILGPAQEAIEQFSEMKAIAIELGDPIAIAQALRNMGETCRLLGRYDDAITYCREALALFRGHEANSADVQLCLFFLGLAHCYAGYPQEAKEYGEEVLSVAEGRKDERGFARAHNVLALANLLLERWDAAATSAQQAREKYSILAMDAVCYAGNSEGMALFGGGRHDEALRALQRALAAAREYNQPRAEGLVLFNQARAFRALEHSGPALQAARAALAIFAQGHSTAALSAAQSLIDGLLASAQGDRATEARHLLACARSSLANADLQPPDDLVREVEACATELQIQDLISSATEVSQALLLRQTKRSAAVGR